MSAPDTHLAMMSPMMYAGNIMAHDRFIPDEKHKDDERIHELATTVEKMKMPIGKLLFCVRPGAAAVLAAAPANNEAANDNGAGAENEQPAEVVVLAAVQSQMICVEIKNIQDQANIVKVGDRYFIPVRTTLSTKKCRSFEELKTELAGE